MKTDKLLNRRLHKKRRGAAAVECAFVAPLFILLVFGSIQVGQMIHVARTVSDASREGARQSASTKVRTVGEVQSAINLYLAQSFPTVSSQIIQAATTVIVRNKDGVEVPNGDLTTINSGTSVSVEVQFDSSAVRWSADTYNIYGKLLKSTSVMRRQ